MYSELRWTTCSYLISLYSEKQPKHRDTITSHVNIGHELFYFANTVKTFSTEPPSDQRLCSE